MRTVLTAERLWDGTRLLDLPVVEIEDGQIASISTRTAKELPGEAQVIDFPGATLAPAFFDVHIHGAKGHDVMEATPAALDAIGGFLASRGTGSLSGHYDDRTAERYPVVALRVGTTAGAAGRGGAGAAHRHSSGRPVSFASEARRAACGTSACARHCHLRPVLRGRRGPHPPDDAGARAARRGGTGCSCHGMRGTRFFGTFKCHRRRDPRRHCRGCCERYAYVQRHAPAGPSRGGNSGHGSHLRHALCRVDLRRHPLSQGDGEAVVEGQRAGARDSGDRCDERHGYAGRRVHVGRNYGAGGQRQSHDR